MFRTYALRFLVGVLGAAVVASALVALIQAR
jgi:hypothetical protein